MSQINLIELIRKFYSRSLTFSVLARIDHRTDIFPNLELRMKYEELFHSLTIFFISN